MAAQSVHATSGILWHLRQAFSSLRVLSAPTCACGKVQASRVHARPSAMLRERKPLGGCQTLQLT